MKLEPIVWPTSLISQRLARTRAIDWVVPGSPAEKAGIRPGFQILSIDGDPPDRKGALVSFFVSGDEVVFYDPDAKQCLSLTHARVPFGFETKPVVNDAFRETVRNGTHFGIDVFEPWLAGDSAVYTTLTGEFEAPLTSQTHAIFGAFIKSAKKNAAMLEHTNRWSQLGLALCLMEEGEFERSDDFLDAYYRNLNSNPNDSDMSEVLALASYLAARQLLRKGAPKEAENYLWDAIHRAPRAKPVLALFEDVFGETFQPNEPLRKGSTIPLSYELQRYDPYELHPHTNELLRYDDAVSKLNDGEYGLVCLLGRYRSNGPFLDELYLLGALQKDSENAPEFVHIVHSFKGDLTAEFNRSRKQSETFFLENGLRFQLGYDPKDEISDAQELTHLPTWFVIRKGGLVSMSGWLRSYDMLADILASR